MIAIAWVDTKDGRRWVAGRATMVLIGGAIALTLGRLVGEPRIVWVGSALVLMGAVSIGWAFFHRARGMPLPPSTSRDRL